ncbi:hypothetical protein BDZ89DRAFT_119006 [Hymenopellis radicata]|nr:hypothetical protein BDZ89DRAFT_119006 [Hymenopellis radicata]
MTTRVHLQRNLMISNRLGTLWSFGILEQTVYLREYRCVIFSSRGPNLHLPKKLEFIENLSYSFIPSRI